MVKSSMTYARHMDCTKGWKIRYVSLWSLEGKLKERNHFGTLVEDWEDKSKSDLKEIWCQIVDLTCLT